MSEIERTLIVLMELLRHNESIDESGDPVGAKPEGEWEEGYAAGVRCVYRQIKEFAQKGDF